MKSCPCDATRKTADLQPSIRPYSSPPLFCPPCPPYPQLPPVPRPFNRDPRSGRTGFPIFFNNSNSDHANLCVTAADIDPLDFDNPPAVMADIIGRMQDLADHGCESVSRSSPYLDGADGLPRTPLQLLLRLTEDAGDKKVGPAGLIGLILLRS